MRLGDLARLRQVAYRLLSSTLLYPGKRRVEAVVAAARELRTGSVTMAEFAFFPQWTRLLATLGNLPPRDVLEQEYVRVFMHSPRGNPCPPYESAYVDPGGQATGWVLALLEREYATAGLAQLPFLKEPPDHVSVELEFMAFLCDQEGNAWDRRATREGVQALERQATFLGGHLAPWIPEWARRVADSDDAGTYSAVAEATRAFVSHERDLVCLLLDRYREMLKGVQAGEIVGTSHRFGVHYGDR